MPAKTKPKPKPAPKDASPPDSPVEDAEVREPTAEVAPAQKVTATCPMCGEEYESYGAVLCSQKCNRRARRLFPSERTPLAELPEKLARWHERQAAAKQTTESA